MQLFDPFFYEKAHLLAVFLLSVFLCVFLSRENADQLLRRNRHQY